MNKLLYIVIPFWLLGFSAFSQEIIKGIVKDESGSTIPGANIVVKGTNTYALSDASGAFILKSNAPLPVTLSVSMVGFAPQEVEIYELTEEPLEVQLKNDNLLDEVVVIGYGEQSRKNVTGAVVSLKPEDLNPGANVSVDQLMLGRSAGVRISQSSSEPGGGLSIRIRGASSVNAGNEPLYVIDGFPIDNSPLLSGGGVAGMGPNNNPKNPLNALNPNDIQSIEILKDASATAIYGSRGANGVILITTKKGNSGRTNVSYDGYAGLQSVAKKMDLLSTGQYIDAMNGISQDRGEGDIFSAEDIARIGNGVDWQDEVYRPAPVQSHNISVGGGDDRTTFYSSFNYFDQQGIVDNSGMKRFTARLNLNRKISKKVNFGINLNTSLVKDDNNSDGMATNESAGPIYASLLYDPTEPIYNADGTFNQSANLTVNNPVSLIKGISSESETNRTFGNAYLEYEIIDGLRTKLNVGSDRQSTRRDVYNSKLTFRGGPAGGIANVSTLERSNILVEYTLDYSKQLNTDDQLDVLGGVMYQNFVSRAFAGNISGFPSDALGTDNLGLGNTNNDNLSSNHEENSLLSYLARVNYQLNQKYIFTGSIRADGSSRFGTNNKFGYFPSVAFAWRLSEESFIPEFFDGLKLRTSWGQTGNQEIVNYTALSTYESSTTAIINNQPVVTLRPSRIANPDLKWETTEQTNIGLDASIYGGRISTSIDYFIKSTSDVLLYQPLPSATGYRSVLSNVGSIRNTGIEVLINAILVEGNDFSWSATGNFSAIRNKVTDLGPIGDIYTGNVTNVGTTSILREGYPVNSYYGYQITGIFQQGDDIANSAQPNSRPGFPIFKDNSGDGAITPDDQVIIGNPYPDFTYGLNNTLTYKNFQLDIFFQGQQGGDLLNINVIESMYPGNVRRNRIAEQSLDRWTPENTDAKWPSGTEPSSYGGGKVNTLVLQDASYVRLKNVQLGYTFRPTKYLQSAKVYVVGQNLFTSTDYAGFDPESNSFGRSNERVDYSSYPLARTWLLGVNLTF